MILETKRRNYHLHKFIIIYFNVLFSMESIVAHNLAQIGDEIDRIYGLRLDRMIKMLPKEECPLEMFYNVSSV